MRDEETERHEEAEPIEIDVGERRYRLIFKRWPWKVSRRWVVLLTKRAMALAATVVTNKVSAELADDQAMVDVAGLLDSFDEATFERFFDDAEEYTVAVEITPGVEAKAVAFTKITALLDGRADLPLRIARAHAELQLTPFFASLRGVLGELGPPPAKAETTNPEASS